MITVIAGVNGAGKSSITGSNLRANGGDFFNPDEISRLILQGDPSVSEDQANAQAWEVGFELLTQAIANNDDYIFETTLGGDSICNALHHAVDIGCQLRVIYCGLASAELHIERVAARVAKGGHNIPEQTIRERWKNSTVNMIGLIPRCYAVRVFDNSAPADAGGPHPVSLFTLIDGTFVEPPIADMPEWAKPLAGAALKTVLT